MTESIPIHHRSHLGTTILMIVAVWFVLAFVGSLLGVFANRDRPPMLLGTMALVPILIYGIWHLRSAEFRQYIRSADTHTAQLLTLAQTWRVGGIVFVVLYYRGILPAAFALPAGWGDVAIGVTAPLAAWLISSPTPLRSSIAIAWNILGILDLVSAVTLGVLASPGVALLADQATTQAMGQFPLSLIPTFFVPLLLIFHLATLTHLRRRVVGSRPPLTFRPS